MIFPKKLLFGENGPFGTKNDPSLRLWIYSKNFLKGLYKERDEQVDESNINGFYLNVFVLGKWAILNVKMAHPHNAELALSVFLKHFAQ